MSALNDPLRTAVEFGLAIAVRSEGLSKATTMATAAAAAATASGRSNAGFRSREKRGKGPTLGRERDERREGWGERQEEKE